MGGVNALGPIHSSPILTSPDAFALSLLEATTQEEVLATFGPLKKRRLVAYLRVRGREAAWLADFLPEVTALRRAAKADDAQALLAARARLLHKLSRSPEPSTTRFAPREELLVRIRDALQAAQPQSLTTPEAYRAERLYISPAIGGGSIPIRPGISETIPLRPHPIPRVLFVSLFPINSNGSGTYTRAMAEYIEKRGGDSRVLFLGHHFEDSGFPAPQYLVPFTHPNGTGLEGAAKANLPVFDANPASPNGIRFKNLPPEVLQAYAEGLADAVTEAARHMQPDVLVVNHAWVGALAAKRTGLPYVVVCHGTCLANMEAAMDSRNGYPSNLAELVLPGVRGANRVIAITQEVEERVRRTYGVPEDQTIVIENGFDNEVFQPRRDASREAVLRSFGLESQGVTHIVSFAGRMVSYKGVATLLRAARIVQQSMPGVHFLLAGDGKDRLEYERLALRWEVDSVVHFLGHVNHEQAALLHNIADVGVVPSWREPFGIVPLEIAGVGTPVIASAVGGLRDTVTPLVGLQVPPQYPKALADAIITALQTDLKARIGKRASNHVHARYPWHNRGDELLRVLREVIERNPLRRGEAALQQR